MKRVSCYGLSSLAKIHDLSSQKNLFFLWTDRWDEDAYALERAIHINTVKWTDESEGILGRSHGSWVIDPCGKTNYYCSPKQQQLGVTQYENIFRRLCRIHPVLASYKFHKDLKGKLFHRRRRKRAEVGMIIACKQTLVDKPVRIIRRQQQRPESFVLAQWQKIGGKNMQERQRFCGVWDDAAKII